MTNSKIFGSTLIIAGTTIGAGMLALPLASAGIGFTTSLLLMLVLWALMAFTALLMVELHQHALANATLHTLAKQFLGEKGKWLATSAMLFLFYALCAAYIAGGGAQFGERLNQLFDLTLTPKSATILFTAIVAIVVTIGTSAVDKLNRVLFIAKMIAMVSVLFFLAPNISESYLLSMPMQQGLIVAALPVIFTSFGFHGSIPVIVNYLDGNTRALKKAIVIGSAIPLIIYIFWQLVTLGVLSQQEMAQNQGLSALISQLTSKVHVGQLSHIIGVFADLALLTSFFGVSLGLFEFLGDSMKNHMRKPKRWLASLVTFLPPMVFALFYPQGFITALGYAAIALVVLAIFLPVAMVKKSRATHQQANLYQVKGGRFALVTVSVIGGIIVIVQLLVAAGNLPALG
ncbi:aromatic amino acid transport family protein [Vibrio xiamenensis]|uniref:aromatic amino acid transport family protein n=1 Tax=Vibrio xiamenensis TaxID=861298 RepID=UPI000B88BE6F|nr:aromatic amino acid transport family protein [Vibrio xiamenensis]